MSSNRDFRAEDLLKFKLITQLQISPTQDEIAYELKSIDKEKDAYQSDVWIVSNGAEPRCFTNGAGGSWPRWSPDGSRIAFLSGRNGSSAQVYVIERNGGEARQVTHLNQAVSSLAWSPGGDSLLVTTLVPNEKDSAQDQPRVVDRQRYKLDSSGFLLDGFTHLFKVTLDGEAEQLTHGEFNVQWVDWSPAGDRITICRTRDAIKESHRTDIWILDADGKNAWQASSHVASASLPVWSPDGKWVVFQGAAEEGSSLTRLWLIDVNAKTCTNLGDDDVEVDGLPLHTALPTAWSADSKSVAFLYARKGLSEIATISLETGVVRRLSPAERQVTSVHANKDTIAFIAGSMIDPWDIFTIGWDGQNEKRLTQANADWWNEKELPTFERRKFKMADDEEIDGWLLRPKNASSPVPILVDVHGGPHSYVEFGFPYHVNWYALISQGWGVLAINAAGSTSYGRKFAERLKGHWGELDLPQHLEALSQLQKEGVATSVAAIAGKSYGGYLSAWAVTQTDRFNAAVVSAPVANLLSHAGTSDGGFYSTPYYMDAEVYEDITPFDRLSPVRHAHSASTATLILQGEEDQRCPVGQAEEFFAALMRDSNAPAEMVLYPGGQHGLAEAGKPSHRVHYHAKIVEWCEQWKTKSARAKEGANSRAVLLRKERQVNLEHAHENR